MVRSSALYKLFPLLVLLLGASVGVFIPEFAHGLNALGFRIGNPEMAGDYTIGIMWAGAIWLSIAFWPVPARDRRILSRVWLVRCFVTLGFMLFYEYNYGLDAYHYYGISKLATYDFSQVDIGHGMEFTEALWWTVAHSLPTADSYHALKVISSLIGFLGVYIFYRACVIYLGWEDKRLLYILMLCPSILFWSSILGKDPVHWFGISLYLYGVIGWSRRHKVVYLLPMVGGLGINIMIRLWSAAIFLAPFGLVSVWRVRNIVMRGILILAFLFAANYSMKKFTEHFAAENVEQLVERANVISKSWSRGGSAQQAPEFTSVGGMVKFLPLGMFTALFRPLPGEIMNLFGFLSGFENLVLLSLLIMAIRRGALAALKDDVLLWAVFMVLIWSLFYAFVSFQNLGAAVRFRLQILPVLLALILRLSFVKETAYDVWNRRTG